MTNTPNHDLFIDVLAQIERHPERWNQRQWAKKTECGTSFCFAGWVCVLTLPLHEQDFHWQPDLSTSSRVLVAGRTTRGHVMDVASQELGINTGQAQELFEIYNRLDDLYKISADILGVDTQVLRDKVQDRVHG